MSGKYDRLDLSEGSNKCLVAKCAVMHLGDTKSLP